MSAPTRSDTTGMLALMLAFVLTACTGPSSTSSTTSTTAGPPPSSTTSSTAPPSTTTTVGDGPAPSRLVIGVEYVLLDNPVMIERQAAALAEAGFTAAKPIAEAIAWDAMQEGPEEPIDFGRLDDFVMTFQEAGFTDFTLALKSHSTWASVGHGFLRTTNAAPQPEFQDDYAAWVGAVVERYDGDGIDDMPGLAHPIHHYEIGSEFSSFEPEPVDVYLEMLEIAYEAAHQADPDVMVGHAAFLVMDLLLDHPDPADIPDGTGVNRYGPHTFGDIRAILDRPELFDFLNIHALAHPGEIELMVRWLDWETNQRGYRKPIVISDTSINPFIAFGPANVCDRPPNQMGLVFHPATEEDRCRLAEYFGRVLDDDAATVEWMRAYVAADMVKKVVISAEQRINLINTAFVTDLPLLDSPIGQAGAGNAGWGGMIEISTGTRYPNFHAMRQLMARFDDTGMVRRIDVDGPEGTRVYELEEGRLWVAWYDPPFLVLHDDPPETANVTVPTGPGTVVVEEMIDEIGQTTPEQTEVDAGEDGVTVTLEQRPVYLTIDR